MKQSATIRELSVKEVQEVNGGFGWIGGFQGAAVTIAGYSAGAAASGGGSPWGFGAAAAIGFIGGAFAGPFANSYMYHGARAVAFGGGYASGVADGIYRGSYSRRRSNRDPCPPHRSNCSS